MGFICDLPYYNNEEDYQPGDMIQLNAEYRCRVVRLMDPDDGDDDYDVEYSLEFKVQILSSETGEWRETTVLSAFNFSLKKMSPSFGVASTRMLYWMSDDGDILIQMTPSMIDKSASASLSTTTCYRRRFSHEWDFVPVRCIAAMMGVC